MEEPKPKFIATMTLPKNGKQTWTDIMYGQSTISADIETQTPIVSAYAVYEDGTSVLGGVCKSEAPTDHNNKFMWVFDKNGKRYPGFPIDTRDNEDFLGFGYLFSLSEEEEDQYLLNIVEEK